MWERNGVESNKIRQKVFPRGTHLNLWKDVCNEPSLSYRSDIHLF